jgi:hypothetical protein
MARTSPSSKEEVRRGFAHKEAVAVLIRCLRRNACVVHAVLGAISVVQNRGVLSRAFVPAASAGLFGQSSVNSGWRILSISRLLTVNQNGKQAMAHYLGGWDSQWSIRSQAKVCSAAGSYLPANLSSPTRRLTPAGTIFKLQHRHSM